MYAESDKTVLLDGWRSNDVASSMRVLMEKSVDEPDNFIEISQVAFFKNPEGFQNLNTPASNDDAAKTIVTISGNSNLKVKFELDK